MVGNFKLWLLALFCQLNFMIKYSSNRDPFERKKEHKQTKNKIT